MLCRQPGGILYRVWVVVAAVVFLLASCVQLAAAILVLRALPAVMADLRAALRPPYGPAGPLK